MDALSASLKARDGKDGEPKKPAPAKKPARKRASGPRGSRRERPLRQRSQSDDDSGQVFSTSQTEPMPTAMPMTAPARISEG